MVCSFFPPVNLVNILDSVTIVIGCSDFILLRELGSNCRRHMNRKTVTKGLCFGKLYRCPIF